MKKGGGRNRPKQQNSVAMKAARVAHEIQDYQYWLGLARSIVPGEKDEWRLGEIACLLQQFALHIGKHYGTISDDIEETQKKAIAFSVPCEIDRANTPPEVFVGLKWSKKFGDGGTVKVPDPSQSELPLEVEQGRRGPDADEANPPTEGEQLPET